MRLVAAEAIDGAIAKAATMADRTILRESIGDIPLSKSDSVLSDRVSFGLVVKVLVNHEFFKTSSCKAST
jgi:hypothetical protein